MSLYKTFIKNHVKVVPTLSAFLFFMMTSLPTLGSSSFDFALGHRTGLEQVRAWGVRQAKPDPLLQKKGWQESTSALQESMLPSFLNSTAGQDPFANKTDRLKGSYLTSNNTDTQTPQLREGRKQMGRGSVWVQPTGQFTRIKQNLSRGITGLYGPTGAISFGGDYEITPKILVGLLGSFSRMTYTLVQNQGSGSINSGSGGVYGGLYQAQGVNIAAQALFGRVTFDANRNQTASITPGPRPFPPTFRGSTNFLTANNRHTASQFSGTLNLGYAFLIGQTLSLQPFLLGNYVSFNENGYTESGAGIYNLTVTPRRTRYLTWEPGLSFFKTFIYDTYLLRPMVQIGFMQQRTLTTSGGTANAADAPYAAPITGGRILYNQVAPALGLVAQFKNGFLFSGVVNAALGGGMNTGSALIRAGYIF